MFKKENGEEECVVVVSKNDRIKQEFKWKKNK